MGLESISFNMPNTYTGFALPQSYEQVLLPYCGDLNNQISNDISLNLADWGGLDSFNYNNISSIDAYSMQTMNPFGLYSGGFLDYGTPYSFQMNFGDTLKSLFEQSNKYFQDYLSRFSNYQGQIGQTGQTPPATSQQGEYIPPQYKKNKSCNQDYIAELTPIMQNKVRQLEAYAKSQGIPFVITEGYRTRDEQLALIQKYSHQPGRTAGADTSRHRKGMAIDIRTGNLTEEQCRKLGNYAKSIGMKWGGDFKKFRENWHFHIS